MPANVITLSSRSSLPAAERMARARVARDGVARFGALSSSPRRVWLLEKLADLLYEGGSLTVTLGAGTDGCTYLTAFPVGERPAAVWGDLNGADRPADVVLDV